MNKYTTHIKASNTANKFSSTKIKASPLYDNIHINIFIIPKAQFFVIL